MPANEAHAVLDGTGRAKEDRPSFCLEFVNMNTSSPAEKRRNQLVIRSTAMKNFRRRQQSQRTQAKEASRIKEKEMANKEDGTDHKQQYKEARKEWNQDPQDVSSEAVDDWISQTTLTEPLPESRTSSSNQNDSTWDIDFLQVESSRTSNDFFALSSPLTLLGGGRIDPFRIYPTGHVGPHVHELIDHSTSCLWPGLRPRGSGGAANKISSAWLEKVTSRPLIMHAMLFGGAVHMDVLRYPRINIHNPVRLFHKVQTMRLLKEQLKNPGSSDSDELILTVLTLGASELETMVANMKSKVRSPFNSPLSSSQWLDVYGCMPKVKAHTLAMRSLVDRQGGLEKIQLEGLAEVLEFSNILGATQNLSKPYWQLLDRTAKVDTSRSSELLYYPLKSLGHGFQGLKVFGISDNAACVLQDLADLTIAIECYSRGIAPVLDLAMLMDRRNCVQHALLSLPTADELEFGEVSSVSLYEAIRYAAIIYSIAVTFPLPPITGIYGKLTRHLKSVLEESKHDLCWALYPKALLWTLTLGGIASSVTVHRSWYVRNLAAASAALNISRWDDVADEMGEYLWLERACDVGGRELWLEVSRERYLDNHFEEEDI